MRCVDLIGYMCKLRRNITSNTLKNQVTPLYEYNAYTGPSTYNLAKSIRSNFSRGYCFTPCLVFHTGKLCTTKVRFAKIFGRPISNHYDHIPAIIATIRTDQSITTVHRMNSLYALPSKSPRTLCYQRAHSCFRVVLALRGCWNKNRHGTVVSNPTEL